ncbi:hypothetical protein BJP34_05645 [Moorena producens PAL-8-15-08-1]|uniref:DUF3893 domain-containing protein n=1 Tax=Moorena producens PAL-8-15-08-1 TaxID=1458985 RepID=A0A1D8TMX4_9CYAN|nr:RNaseH domain-containing protein [Moorena producens]AOW98997.1 hypothetical protein BJP34_05645 [Moorena producens PAL-8-15-08-1]
MGRTEYNTIRLGAFRVKEQHQLPAQQFYALKFPELAKDLIKSLVAQRDSRLNKPVRIPISSLNAALRVIIPALIYIDKIWEEFWLYSRGEIPINQLLVILSHWLDTEFPDQNPNRRKNGITFEQRQAVMEVLCNNLQWESVTLETDSWQTFPNGTANITENSNSFILLPDIIATELSKPGVTFKLDDKTIQFYRCSPMTRPGAELISWPPESYRYKQRIYYYSIALQLTVQTVPFQPYPQLQCDLITRRWCSLEKTGLLSEGQASSVYIRTQVKWGKAINPDGDTEYFQVAPMVWKGEATWANNLAKLLAEVNPLPYTPKQILANPVQALNIDDSPNICITYKDGMNPKHKVGKGFPPNDYRQLMEQIALLLKDNWESINYQRFKYNINSKVSAEPFDLPKPDGISWTIANSKKLKNYEKEAKRLPKAIGNCIGKELTIEIWYIHESTLDALRKAVCYCLGLTISTENTDNFSDITHHFPDIDLTLTIRSQPIGKLAEPLPLSTDNNKTISQKRKDAIKICMGEIAETIKDMPPTTGKVGVFVELYDENHWKSKWTDPKAAIRLGFAQEKIDRVSQFIAPNHEEFNNTTQQLQNQLVQKAISSVLDLLRSLGVQITPPRIVIPSVTLPDPITYVALWLVSRTGKTSAHGKQQLIPCMVKMRSDSQSIEATFNGLSKWLPYDEALVKLNKLGKSITGDDKQKSSEIKRFIRGMLQRKELRGKDTLLLCDAQNLRRYWKWLQDSEISQEGLVFGLESPQLIPNLRVVRVREDEESPNWYALHDTDKQKVKLFYDLVDLEKLATSTYGLFDTKSNDRIFLSIGEKASTMSKISHDSSKFKKPKENWTHPQIVELTVACIQPGDKPEHWAIVTHELRQMALQYNSPLARPIVLHLAAQMPDYVLMVDEESSEEET